MPIQMTLKAPPDGVGVKLWTDTAQSETLDQRKNVARLPITYSHVAAMPDVHYGRGATVSEASDAEARKFTHGVATHIDNARARERWLAWSPAVTVGPTCGTGTASRGSTRADLRPGRGLHHGSRSPR